jgi:hypothetical protein
VEGYTVDRSELLLALRKISSEEATCQDQLSLGPDAMGQFLPMLRYLSHGGETHRIFLA